MYDEFMRQSWRSTHIMDLCLVFMVIVIFGALFFMVISGFTTAPESRTVKELQATIQAIQTQIAGMK